MDARDSRTPKLLILDDDRVFTEILMHKCQLGEIDCLCVSKPEDFFRLLGEGPPDAILIDISMSGVDAFAILKKIKRDRATADIPVAIMSSDSRQEEIDLGRKLGADRFFNKLEVLPGDIVNIVRGMLR